jgi:hypothetical protein
MKFSIDEFKSRARALPLDGIDFDSFRDQPLDPATLRCLRAIHDVEHHTICYLRDVLVTDAHKDHELTTFMALWTFEEFWHGEALGRVLEAHDEPGSDVRVRALRLGKTPFDRLRPVLTIAASAATRHVPAVHMTWGAINEWTTQAVYARVAAKADHPVLSELLDRIRRQEGKHIDFYATQARARLEVSERAQRLTRFTLQRFWKPVGSGVIPDAEMRHITGHLFLDDDGRRATARIDRNVDRLPGLDGMNLLERATLRLAA